jgi:hypothetical protein
MPAIVLVLVLFAFMFMNKTMTEEKKKEESKTSSEIPKPSQAAPPTASKSDFQSALEAVTGLFGAFKSVVDGAVNRND